MSYGPQYLTEAYGRGYREQSAEALRQYGAGEISPEEYGRRQEAITRAYDVTFQRIGRGELTLYEQTWLVSERTSALYAKTKRIHAQAVKVRKYAGEVKEYTGAVRESVREQSLAVQTFTKEYETWKEARLQTVPKPSLEGAGRVQVGQVPGPKVIWDSPEEKRKTELWNVPLRNVPHEWKGPLDPTITRIAGFGQQIKGQALEAKDPASAFGLGALYMGVSIAEGGVRAVASVLDPVGVIQQTVRLIQKPEEIIHETVEAFKYDPVRTVGHFVGGYIVGTGASRLYTKVKGAYIRRRYVLDIPDEAFIPYDDAVLQAIPEEVSYSVKEPAFIEKPPTAPGESAYKFVDDVGDFKPLHVEPGETIVTTTGRARVSYKDVGVEDLKPFEPLTIVKSKVAEARVVPKTTIEMKVASAPRTAHLPGVWRPIQDIIIDQPGPGALFYERTGQINRALSRLRIGVYADPDILPKMGVEVLTPVYRQEQEQITDVTTTPAQLTKFKAGQIVAVKPAPLQLRPISRTVLGEEQEPGLIPRPYPPITIQPTRQVSRTRIIQTMRIAQRPRQVQRPKEQARTITAPVPGIPTFKPLTGTTFERRRRLRREEKRGIGRIVLSKGEKRIYDIKTPEEVLRGFKL